MGGDAASRGYLGFLVKSAVLLVAAATAVLLGRQLLRYYYFGGSLFGHDFATPRIEHVEIVGGETITAPFLRELLELEEGRPLFERESGFCGDDLVRKKDMLLKAPTLATVTLTRTMAESFYVAVTERVPIARIEDGSIGNLAMDRYGHVFVCRSGLERLPALTGIPKTLTAPGMNLLKEIRMIPAAIELLECLADGDSNIPSSMLLRLDVRRKDYLDCDFQMSERKSVMLAWKHMGTGTDSAHAFLVAQLNGMAEAIGKARSRGRSRFDATIPGRCFAL